jgi:hypothetical protein
LCPHFFLMRTPIITCARNFYSYIVKLIFILLVSNVDRVVIATDVAGVNTAYTAESSIAESLYVCEPRKITRYSDRLRTVRPGLDSRRR